LSASGKTTTARALVESLEGLGYETVTLDGDDVRRRLSPELGYSSADRSANVKRIGELARAAVDEGNAVVCAVVSPFAAGRAECRALIGPERFVEVFVDTPLAVCEQRDPQGLYTRARLGELSSVSGLDLPYEAPTSPDVVLDTVCSTVEANVARIIGCLQDRRLISSMEQPASGA
jgi:bifunctional enzyme CysN/CysC